MRRVSTTVLVAATTIDLAVLATVKDDLQITVSSSDAFLSRALTRASAAAAQYCNRIFGAEKVQDTFYTAMAYNTIPLATKLGGLQLTRRPVLAVISLTENGVALTNGTDYYVDAIAGQIFRLDANGNDSRWLSSNVIIIYQGGFVLPAQDPSLFPAGSATLPLDIVDAAGRIVGQRYFERLRDPFIKTEMAFGIGTTEYFAKPADGNLTPDITDILDNYRVPVIG